MKTTNYNSMDALNQRKEELLETIRDANKCIEMAAGYEMNDRKMLIKGAVLCKSAAKWALINVQNQIDGV